IAGIEFDHVLIHVHAGLFPADLPPRLAAIGASIEIGVHGIDRVGTKRIDKDLLVVRGTAASIPVTCRFSRWRRRRTPGTRSTLRPTSLGTHSTLSTGGT